MELLGAAALDPGFEELLEAAEKLMRENFNLGRLPALKDRRQWPLGNRRELLAHDFEMPVFRHDSPCPLWL